MRALPTTRHLISSSPRGTIIVKRSSLPQRTLRLHVTPIRNSNDLIDPPKSEYTTNQPSFPYEIVATLATAGVIETSYLTLSKLTGSEIACPLSGSCATILTSDYASLWGIVPLSAMGILAYGAVAAVAIAGIQKRQDNLVISQVTSKNLENNLQISLLAGSLILSTTSAYLMYILFTAFPGDVCPWCIGSAFLSAAITAVSISGFPRRKLEEAAAPVAGLAALTFFFLAAGLGSPELSQAGTGITELEYKQPEITTESPPEALDLARRLKKAGATMYGAFWCSHCYEQKQIFGQEAMEEFPYVECFPEGWKQGIEMNPACTAAKLEGFPTWVIGDQRLEGAQSLDVLQDALKKIEK